MTDDTKTSKAESLGDLEHDAEQTREALGETVEALAAKADVKERAKQTVVDIRSKAPAPETLKNRRVLIGALATAAATVGLAIRKFKR